MLTLHQPSQPIPHRMMEDTRVTRCQSRAGARRQTRHEPDEPAAALLEEVHDRLGGLLEAVPVDPARAAALGHLHQGPPRVLGDRPGRAEVEPDLLLDVVADQDERPVHAEGALAELVLQAEPAQIVAGADRVGQGEKGVLGQVAVVEHDALADAQLARALLLGDRTVDAPDDRGGDVGLLVQVEEPCAVGDRVRPPARSAARAP